MQQRRYKMFKPGKFKETGIQGDKTGKQIKMTKSSEELLNAFRQRANMLGDDFPIIRREIDTFIQDSKKGESKELHEHSRELQDWDLVEGVDRPIEQERRKLKDVLCNLEDFKREYKDTTKSIFYRSLQLINRMAENSFEDRSSKKSLEGDKRNAEAFDCFYEPFQKHAKEKLSNQFSKLGEKLLTIDSKLRNVDEKVFKEGSLELKAIKERFQQVRHIVDGSQAWINNDLDVNNSERQKTMKKGHTIASRKLGDRLYDPIFNPKNKPERTIRMVLDSMSKVKEPDERTYTSLLEEAENIKAELATYHSTLESGKDLFPDLEKEIKSDSKAMEMLQEIKNSYNRATPNKDKPLVYKIEDFINDHKTLAEEYRDFQEKNKTFVEEYGKFQERNKGFLEEYEPLLNKKSELKERSDRISKQKKNLTDDVKLPEGSPLDRVITRLKEKIQDLDKRDRELKAFYEGCIKDAESLKSEESQLEEDKTELDKKFREFDGDTNKKQFVEEYNGFHQTKNELDESREKFSKKNNAITEAYKILQEKHKLLALYANQFNDSVAKLVNEGVIKNNKDRLSTFQKQVTSYSSWLSELKFAKLEDVRDFVKSPQEFLAKAVEVSTNFKSFPEKIQEHVDTILKDIEELSS